MEIMRRTLRCLRWLTAISVLIAALLLAWQCMDIYRVGNSPTNLDANGVHIQSIFRMEDIRIRLQSISLPLVIIAMICLVSIVAHVCIAYQNRHDARGATRLKKVPPIKPTDKPASRHNHISLARVLIAAAAILFILLGVMNGGLRDVLYKAISICTECIGLG